MGRRRSGARWAACGAAIAMVVLAACSPPTSDRAADGADRAAAAEAATRALEAAKGRDRGCAHVVMSEEARVTSPPEHLVLLTDAVAVREPCWDKIEFTFAPTGADMPPGYEIGYREPPFTEGDEGQFTVETLGNAFLFLTLTPASETSPDGEQTYPGNLRLRLEGMHHTEIVRKLIDGPGTVMWLIGLDARRPFTVDAANDPPRVIVYVAR